MGITRSAPFAPEEAATLNDFQEAGVGGNSRPYSCPRGGMLVAWPTGWECASCSYKQDWAYCYHLRGTWRHRFPAEQFGERRNT